MPVLTDRTDDEAQPKIGRVWGFGHSGMAPYGLADTFKGFLTRFCNLVGCDEANRAIVSACAAAHEDVAGTAGNGGYGKFYDQVNPVVGGQAAVVPLWDSSTIAQQDCVLLWYGDNDIQNYGPDNVNSYGGMTVYRNALRTIIARAKCARVFEESDGWVGTMTFASGSTAITAFATTTGTLKAGQEIRVAGFPAGTRIDSITGATAVASQPSTALGTAVAAKAGTVDLSGGTWTSIAPNAATGVRICSGSGMVYAAADTNYFEIVIPAWFQGGSVVVGFVQDAANNSGQWSVLADGIAIGASRAAPNANGVYSPQGAGPFDFRGAFGRSYPSTPAAPTLPVRSPACIRLSGLSAGTHTIRITAAAHNGTNPGYFDWWGIEANPGPMVGVLKSPKRVNYNAGPPYVIADADVVNLNSYTDSVVAEFSDPAVWTFDLDHVFQKNTAFFLKNMDGSNTYNTHGNEFAHSQMARELKKAYDEKVKALGGNARAAGSGFGYVSLRPNDQDRNTMMSGDYTQPVMVKRNALGQDPAHGLAGGAVAAGNLEEWQSHDNAAVKFAITKYLSPQFPKIADPAAFTGLDGLMWYSSSTGEIQYFNNTALKARQLAGDIGTYLAPHGTRMAAPTSVAMAANNTMKRVMVLILERETITGVQIKVGTASGNVQVALYGPGGAQMAVSAAVALAGASAYQRIPFTAPVTLQIGYAFAAVWVASTAGLIFQAEIDTPADSSVQASGPPASLATPTVASTLAMPVLSLY